MSLLEARLSRIFRHFKGVPMAIFTAWRSDRPDEENEAQNQLLADEIRAMGYGFFDTLGIWRENEEDVESETDLEPGFTVPSMEYEEASRPAKKYEQWSFAWSDGGGMAQEYTTGLYGSVPDATAPQKDAGVPKPWTRFQVFMDPKKEQIKGGTQLTRANRKTRGFALKSEDVPRDEILKQLYGDDPKCYVCKYVADKQIPLDELLIVEFREEVPAAFLARRGLDRVSLGAFDRGHFYGVTHEGKIVGVPSGVDYVGRFGKLFVEGKE